MPNGVAIVRKLNTTTDLGKYENILVFDYESSLLYLNAEILKTHRYIIYTVENANQVLVVFENNLVDLMIF